ncbi:hypothetical protein [Zooshikella harenae]|uniref:Uncharacterized protein n=1 Tax=Zooshikella harenae TaxID=2827238 RepID=A0ABS5ZIT7_9GAMM|nr:hypothetical protein [Zooshikella harenae]MBU2713942.1 hypothetical protein [Zooshikella harenae]
MKKNIGIIACILSILGYFLPLRAEKYVEYGEKAYKSLLDLEGVGFIAFLVVLTIIAILLSNKNWRKTATLIVVIQFCMISISFAYYLMVYVYNSKSGDFWQFFNRGDFSFFSYGWYFIFSGYILQIVSFFKKEGVRKS